MSWCLISPAILLALLALATLLLRPRRMLPRRPIRLLRGCIALLLLLIAGSLISIALLNAQPPQPILPS